MECELYGRKIKYDEGKLWLWREKNANRILNNPYWFEWKGSIRTDGYKMLSLGKRIFYHRLVYYIHNQEWDIHDSSTDNSIDHIDRDKLNNNIENLRVVTNQQNQWNTNHMGYSFEKSRGKYRAVIRINKKTKHLGRFDTEDEARNAYLNAKAKHHHILPATPE